MVVILSPHRPAGPGSSGAQGVVTLGCLCVPSRVSLAVCPRPHTGLAASWETGVTLGTLCSLGPKCSLNSGTEHSLGKCGAGPCNSCSHILHFA